MVKQLKVSYLYFYYKNQRRVVLKGDFIPLLYLCYHLHKTFPLSDGGVSCVLYSQGVQVINTFNSER